MLDGSMLKAGNARGTIEAALSVIEPILPDKYSASGASFRVMPVFCGAVSAHAELAGSACWPEGLSAYAERACSARLSEGAFGMLLQTQGCWKLWCKGSGEQASKLSSKVGCRDTADTIFLKMVLPAMHHMAPNI